MCDLDPEANVMKIVHDTLSGDACQYKVLLKYLEKIRSYAQDKQRPCFKFDLDL